MLQAILHSRNKKIDVYPPTFHDQTLFDRGNVQKWSETKMVRNKVSIAGTKGATTYLKEMLLRGQLDVNNLLGF